MAEETATVDNLPLVQLSIMLKNTSGTLSTAAADASTSTAGADASTTTAADASAVDACRLCVWTLKYNTYNPNFTNEAS